MTPRHLRNIHTRSSCRVGTKTTPYFDLLMEKPLGCCFQVRSPYDQVVQCNRKHLSLYPQGDRSGLGKSKKGEASTPITATTRVHLPRPVSTDLTIKPDSVLTNPIGTVLTNPIGHKPAIWLNASYTI